MVRLAYAHYVSAFYMALLSVLHGIDMHYDWKNETSYDGVETEMVWWDEALANELGGFIDLITLLSITCWFLYPEPEALSYELFMWGDIGLITDVRFYGVAPHWYFRPFMAWLIVCPHHNMGIFGLLYFFWVLFHQPTLHGVYDQTVLKKKKLSFGFFLFKKRSFYHTKYFNPELSLYFQFTYACFVMSALYCSSFLPFGRFYNRLSGNVGMLGAYMYVLSYLTFPLFRRPMLQDLYMYNVYNRVHMLVPYNRDKLIYEDYISKKNRTW